MTFLTSPNYVIILAIPKSGVVDKRESAELLESFERKLAKSQQQDGTTQEKYHLHKIK